jgi:hypothetical protein
MTVVGAGEKKIVVRMFCGLLPRQWHLGFFFFIFSNTVTFKSIFLSDGPQPFQ